jgi:hypothetical protein
MADLLDAHRHTTHNRVEIERSRICACLRCAQIFPPTEIVAWGGLDTSDLEDPAIWSTGTALCPRCGGEAVIGDASGYPIEPDFIGRMHAAWFQKTIIRRPGPAK